MFKYKRSVYVATQWAAVTIQRFEIKAPPQLNFRDRNPFFIRATCQGCDPKPVEWPPTIRFVRAKISPQPINQLRK